MIQATKPVIGTPISRLDGPKKVTGAATYAFEYQFEDVVYAFRCKVRLQKVASSLLMRPMPVPCPASLG